MLISNSMMSWVGRQARFGVKSTKSKLKGVSNTFCFCYGNLQCHKV